MIRNLVTAVIATIPGRERLLAEAFGSTLGQVGAWRVVTDAYGNGAAVTRNDALHGVQTPWVAFLDDDDLWLDDHVATLLGHALDENVDVAYSRCRIEDMEHVPRDGFIPGVPGYGEFRQTGITILVRTALLRDVGGFRVEFDRYVGSQFVGEDYWLDVDLRDAGATFGFVDEVTWVWRVWGGNTSGVPRP